MPQEAYEFYCDAFDKLNASEKWQKEYIEANYIIPRTAVGKDCEIIFKDFHNDTYALYDAMGLAVGEAVQ